jgi:hypothetical protein
MPATPADMQANTIAWLDALFALHQPEGAEMSKEDERKARYRSEMIERKRQGTFSTEDRAEEVRREENRAKRQMAMDGVADHLRRLNKKRGAGQ